MNIYELEKIAKDDSSDQQLVAQAKLLNHKNDNFSKALNALKKEHFKRSREDDLEHTLGRCHTCKLISELEEVK